MPDSRLQPDSLCVHAGMTYDTPTSLIPPIYQTSAFCFESTAQGGALFAGKEEGYIYTRMGNPTIQALEKAVADLEGGSGALACSSGMAAINTVFSGLLKSGDHVVCSKVLYGPTHTLLSGIYADYGIETTFVDSSLIDEVKNAIQPETKLVYIETPGNPTIDISDIQQISTAAHAAGAVVVVDNTFMSPYFQTPLALGADMVVHSLTKFLNGHSDVIGGMIVVKEKTDYKMLRPVLNQTGGVIDPFNAFLVHRGIKTLALRMDKHAENALAVATYLNDHPKVSKVRYPGLKNHPQYALGKKQHSGDGGIIAFELIGGIKAGQTLLDNLNLCVLAVSLGGVETLIQHPASMTHASMGKKERHKAGVMDGLIRLSVGIENPDDIIADLAQALDKS